MLDIEGADAVATGDTPYDAEVTIDALCGGFTERLLRQAGCADIFPGLAALFARFGETLLAR